MPQEAIPILLEPQRWERFGRTGLKHSRTGMIVWFHGIDAETKRDQHLRRLRQLPPRPTNLS
jgi:hypothetical protein